MPTKKRKRAKRKHVCANRFHAEGARGGAYIELDEAEQEGFVSLGVGWSCVVVHSPHEPIPVTWIAEVFAIVTAYKGGIAGFLKDHGEGGADGDGKGGRSWALMVDPAPDPEKCPHGQPWEHCPDCCH